MTDRIASLAATVARLEGQIKSIETAMVENAVSPNYSLDLERDLAMDLEGSRIAKFETMCQLRLAATSDRERPDLS